MIARLNVPYFTNFTPILPFAAALTGGLVMLACMLLKKKVPVLGDFALSVSIVAGVVVCCIIGG